MNEQKMDSERAAFEDWADSQWPGAKREQLKCDAYGEYLNSIYRDLWRGWQARAVYQAEECLTGCLASPDIARNLDADTVRKIVANLQAARFAMLAAPTVKAEQGTTGDRYRADLYDEVWQKARDMGYGNVTEALVALERLKKSPSLPAPATAGVEEVEVVAYRSEPGQKNEPLMTVAQHNRIVNTLQKENEHLIYLLSCAKIMIWGQL